MMVSVRRDKAGVLSRAIERGINSYLGENADRCGSLFVEGVVLSGDLKRATVYLPGDVQYLEKHRREISQYLKRTFQTKYFPTFIFKSTRND